MSSRKIEVRPPAIESISAKDKENEAMMLCCKTESTESYDEETKQDGLSMIDEVDVQTCSAQDTGNEDEQTKEHEAEVITEN
jgi:hypothetical protein